MARESVYLLFFLESDQIPEPELPQSQVSSSRLRHCLKGLLPFTEKPLLARGCLDCILVFMSDRAFFFTLHAVGRHLTAMPNDFYFISLIHRATQGLSKRTSLGCGPADTPICKGLSEDCDYLRPLQLIGILVVLVATALVQGRNEGEGRGGCNRPHRVVFRFFKFEGFDRITICLCSADTVCKEHSPYETMWCETRPCPTDFFRNYKRP